MSDGQFAVIMMMLSLCLALLNKRGFNYNIWLFLAIVFGATSLWLSIAA